MEYNVSVFKVVATKYYYIRLFPLRRLEMDISLFFSITTSHIPTIIPSSISIAKAHPPILYTAVQEHAGTEHLISSHLSLYHSYFPRPCHLRPQVRTSHSSASSALLRTSHRLNPAPVNSRIVQSVTRAARLDASCVAYIAFVCAVGAVGALLCC
jgi:hypothetical protein